MSISVIYLHIGSIIKKPVQYLLKLMIWNGSCTRGCVRFKTCIQFTAAQFEYELSLMFKKISYHPENNLYFTYTNFEEE